MTDERRLTASMTVEQWYWIDAYLDSDISVESVGGDEGIVADNIRIREAGWEQVSGSTRQRPVSHRPPPGATCTVSLTKHEWDRVLSCLQRWSSASANAGGANLPVVRLRDDIAHQLARSTDR